MKTFDCLIDPKGNNNLNELWLQNVWRKNLIAQEQLFTTTGEHLQILFPGWYNKSWGPDFTESRILVDGNEYFGDIEVHIDEAAWFQHSHHLNEAYNKVILHVFFKPSESSAINKFGQHVPSLCLRSSFLDSFWEKHMFRSGVKKDEIPGACGLALNENSIQTLTTLIQQAAENRMINKSRTFEKSIKNQPLDAIENSLFSSICRSLGYSGFNEELFSLSERFPYARLKEYLKSLHRQSRVEILSRWLGYLGVFDSLKPLFIYDDLRREWLTLTQKWKEIEEAMLTPTPGIKLPSRPMNNPIRRLIGLYYHLETTRFKGLLNSWIGFLFNCRSLISKNNGKSNILAQLDQLFPHPNWDPFTNFYLTDNQCKNSVNARFIGKQRQLIILVNSIIPFFLAWSRVYRDKMLEKILFGLLLVLPNEGKNKKTGFMENRLFKNNDPTKIRKNLGYYQGLIQIHDECCTNFYEGCKNCSLLTWLHSSH
jgi:hypothetical protein